MKANKFIAIALAALTFMACNKKDQPTALKLNATSIEVAVAANYQLTANIEVTWSSENADIASVNDKGLVIGVAEGETRIKAAATKTNEVAYCAVKVTKGGVTPPYEAPISITDNSLDDWNALDKNFVVEAVCPEDASLLGLKMAKVYADEMYIFIQIEPDPETVVDLAWVPFHVYLNTDNSDATGGYSDEFTDPNADILLEGVVYADGAPCSYAPGVFKWWGPAGETGWDYWTDPATAPHGPDDKWGAIVGEGELVGTASQNVNGIFEIQIMRELIPATWSDSEFGIGFDIQQSWSSVGVLPLVSPTDDNPQGYAHKLQVKIKK